MADTATARTASLSPRQVARFAGIFQLLEGITATFAQIYLLNTFVVARNPAATAERILANEPLFQLGFAASLIAVAFHLGRALMMFELLKIVRRNVALLALLVILVGCAIQAVASVFFIAQWAVLKSASPGFPLEQVQATSFLMLRLNASAFNVYLVFFGLWNLLIGYLILRSDFMPRILGALLMVTGVAWMFQLGPTVASQLEAVIMIAAAIGEIPLLLWLLVKGVNNDLWFQQAHQHAERQTFGTSVIE
jgi:hypothetical protein